MLLFNPNSKIFFKNSLKFSLPKNQLFINYQLILLYNNSNYFNLLLIILNNNVTKNFQFLIKLQTMDNP